MFIRPMLMGVGFTKQPQKQRAAAISKFKSDASLGTNLKVSADWVTETFTKQLHIFITFSPL